jgi:type IV pilus assembly protein PilB
MELLEFLVQQGVIEAADVPALSKAVQEEGKSLDTLLKEKGIGSRQLVALKAKYYNLPTRQVKSGDVSFEILKYIPEESAKYYQFVPIGVKDGVLEVGLLDPDNTQARDALQFISTRNGMPYKAYLISEEDFEEVLKTYKGLRGEVSKALTELETELVDEKEDAKDLKKLAGKLQEASKGEGNTQIVEDAPVTKIVAVILRHATEGNASDVHIEQMRDKTRVRFRVDGVLYTSLLLPATVHDAVVARIKILANLKLDEKRKPQDGRFSTRVENKKIDFRVSTFPSYYGEKVVMRILDPSKGMRPLDQIGLTKEHLTLVRKAMEASYGIILVTGPTGSGKTTTLYSILNELDREGMNIVSLEDPVEYSIEGVSQSQVKPEIGYTFANGLRSILRQDPDVILVGEIRDKETAQLAIQAALTGHLVLSTLHTNNAIGVVPRLVDMGVDPFLIAPTLILAVGQRLVRMICPKGKEKVPMDESLRTFIDREIENLPDGPQKQYLATAKEVYKAKPTPDCPSGTRGRIAVFELLDVDDDIEHIILKDPVEQEIWKVARAKGMTTMREDAVRKTIEGSIPFEEVYKV